MQKSSGYYNQTRLKKVEGEERKLDFGIFSKI